ncbi:unnamed protein product [Ectocarpus sp. 12 AP-2014]
MASISSIVGGTSFSFTTGGLTLPDGGEAARGEFACQARARSRTLDVPEVCKLSRKGRGGRQEEAGCLSERGCARRGCVCVPTR